MEINFKGSELEQKNTKVQTQETHGYQIRLPVFEGPLDLLLHLIKKNKIDIYDIPIAEITRQYLEYLEMMKELNLEIAGEFLVMAATLIQIKTRMLLPVDEDLPEEQRQDPRWQLVERLLEYQAIKLASQELMERYQQWEGVFWRGPVEIEKEEPQILHLFELNAYDLYEAFRRVLERAPAEVREIAKQSLTVRERMTQIMEYLKDKELVKFEELFEPKNRGFLIITFVAVLELVRLKIIRVFQGEPFGQIWLSPLDREAEIPDNLSLN